MIIIIINNNNNNNNNNDNNNRFLKVTHKVIHYNGTEQWPTYLIWGLLLTNNEYKHNDMKWNIIDKNLQIWMMMMKIRLILDGYCTSSNFLTSCVKTFPPSKLDLLFCWLDCENLTRFLCSVSKFCRQPHPKQ